MSKQISIGLPLIRGTTPAIGEGMRIKIKSKTRMSNRSYHAEGKPTWWARIGDTFLALPAVRGDEYLSCVVTAPEGTTEITIGCGSRARGCRETLKVALRTPAPPAAPPAPPAAPPAPPAPAPAVDWSALDD